MLLATNEYLNHHYIKERPRTVVLIASFMLMPYNELGLAPNPITYSEMLLATNAYNNLHVCTYAGPRTVGSISSSEILNTRNELLDTKARAYRMKY